MTLEHGATRYQVGEKVADTATYRIYLCEEMETKRQCLLQIATRLEHNGGLQRAAFLLKKLRAESDRREAIHAEAGGEKLLSYERLFPEVVDSFVSLEQGGRRVNILAIAEVDDVTSMMSLVHVTRVNHVRVSLKSSAWIMGRLLKLLDLVHCCSMSVGALTGKNILIQPDRHFVVVLDWSTAKTYNEVPPRSVRKDEIAAAAKAVIEVIGGDPETGTYPYPNDYPDYTALLWRLASRRESDAYEAHEQFYRLVDSLWERKFNPLETLPL